MQRPTACLYSPAPHTTMPSRRHATISPHVIFPSPGIVPQLPEDLWAYIYYILAEQRRAAGAVVMQAAFRGYRVRIGPLRFVLRYIRKGNLIRYRAAYSAIERQQQRCAAGAVVIQAAFKGYRVRIGPLRFVLRSIRKGNLIRYRAAYSYAYSAIERQRRGHAHAHVVAVP